MRIARFSRIGEVSYGLVLGADGTVPEGVGTANGAPVGAEAGRVQDPSTDQGQLTVAQLAGHPFGGTAQDIKLTSARFGLNEIRLLAPILPSKVVCVGRNYADHIEEMRRSGGPSGSTDGEPTPEPVIFLKPSTAVCGPGDPILRPAALSGQVEYEGAIAVVHGRPRRD